MAYRARTRSTRSSPRRASGNRTRGRAIRAPARRSTRRVSSRSSRPQTVKIVVQTVGASPVAAQTEKQPMRARF